VPRSNQAFNQLLYPVFSKKHSDSVVKHFQDMMDEYRRGAWDDATAKSGKFVEAVMKALWVFVGETVPKGKAYKAGTIMDQIASRAAFPERIRLTIPRACRFVYEIASNRGARHDADEIDSNEMDATVVVGVCAWVLAEMLSFAQKGLDLAQAKSMVEGVTRRRYAFVEDVDGRVYVDIAKSAPEAAVLILWYVYPDRMSNAELIASLIRHEYTEKNATITLSRLGPYVDDDGTGNLRLRNSGLRRAENLIFKALA
jgi:hypothetical protein